LFIHLRLDIYKMFKKIILIIILISLVGFISSQDFNDPEYLNGLNTSELLDLFNSGDLNFSILNNENFMEMILLDENLSLIDNQQIFNEINSRASKDVSILNENPTIKKKWFSAKYGLDDQGAQLKKISFVPSSENDVIVETFGKDATIFNPKDNIGAKVTQEGGLILMDGTEVNRGNLTKINGTLNVFDGALDLTNSSGQDFFFNNSILKIGDKEYSIRNGQMGYFNLNNGVASFKGEGITEKDLVSGQIVSKFGGGVKIDESGNKLLGEKTSYLSYSNGEASTGFVVRKTTELVLTGNCNPSQSCIKYSDRKMQIYPQDNEMDIFSFDKSVDSIKVNQIQGQGKVIFFENDESPVGAIMTKDNFFLGGDDANFNTDITGEFTVNGQKFTQTYLEGGRLVTQNGNVMGGVGGLKPDEGLIYQSILKSRNKGDERVYKETTKSNLGIEGEDIYLRNGFLDNTLLLEEEGTNLPEIDKRDENLFSLTEIYQLNSDVVSPTNEIETFASYGKTRNLAIEDALNVAAEKKIISVRSKYTESDVHAQINDDYFRHEFSWNIGETNTGVFIKNYKAKEISFDEWAEKTGTTMDDLIKKELEEDYYFYEVEVEYGELNRNSP